nr:hypothetical protein CFP56_34737 [Quercus suber]
MKISIDSRIISAMDSEQCCCIQREGHSTSAMTTASSDLTNAILTHSHGLQRQDQAEIETLWQCVDANNGPSRAGSTLHMPCAHSAAWQAWPCPNSPSLTILFAEGTGASAAPALESESRLAGCRSIPRHFHSACLLRRILPAVRSRLSAALSFYIGRPADRVK